jgi:phenylpropionate dioxygenase-like ring-hydroxylating dioxygenase large terminal subunit
MQVSAGSGFLHRLRQQLGAVLPEANRAHGIPPACYADNELLELERRAIFFEGWVGLGRGDRWPNSGDYSALDIAGEPVIVLRNRTGKLKAFANSCRHRGSLLLTGDGNCGKIKCPFHWWTYDLNGRLKVYSRMEKAVDFDAANYGLKEFPVAERSGFAWLSFADRAPAIDDWLGDFDAFHQPWDLPQWQSARLREFDVDCNWKTFIEVFNEYYHLQMVHPESISWLYPEPDAADTTSGAYTTQFGATEGAAALLVQSQQYALPAAPGLQGREAMGTRYSWIYPNMTFALSQDSMWIYQATPLAAERSRITQTICFPRASMELADFDERANHYFTRIDAALAEDMPFLLQQQIGLGSRFARQGRFSALEPSVANFAYWYARQLLRHIDSGKAVQ